MRDFDILGFVGFLATLPLEIEHANHSALEKAAVIVEKEAKRVLGTYDYDWAQLADATQEDRSQQGYPANEPGLRSGEMRESIEHKSTDKEAVIGSDDDKMVWFELGTKKQPPRPTLQGALVHKKDEVIDIIGREIVGALAGEVVAGENMMISKI